MGAPLRRPLPPSPCVGVCVYDAGLGCCRGCARTGEEIAEWPHAADARRAEVWARLPERALRLGLRLRRLSWEAEEILDFAEKTLRAGRGRWIVSDPRGEAAFAPAPGEAPSVAREEAEIVAVAADARLRLRVERFVRAFEEVVGDREPRLMLVLPVGRAARWEAEREARPDVAESAMARIDGAAPRAVALRPALPELPGAFALGAVFDPSP